jgi:serine/threonine protein kinase
MTVSREHASTTTEPVSELLLRWQDLRDEGQKPSVEQLCADCPELAEALRARIRAVQAMEGILGMGEHATHEPSASRFGSTPQAGTESACLDSQAHKLPALPHYEVLRVLGQGGMGIVYQARQLQPNRLVALKMILAGSRAGAEQRARFHVEAEAAARLQHPNIVAIYEVGDWEGLPFFTMEWMDGGSLAEVLANSVLPPRTAAHVVATLARAVQFAHERGIIHRDLKPANILLAKAQEADVGPETLERATLKITDFGLAKQIENHDRQTQTGAILGTPSYLAPEQAAGKGGQVGPAADIYALGAILYEALTGRPPFQGHSTLDTLEQVRSREPLPPSRLQPKLPRDLETICLTCLSKEPARRYARADALADDLRRFLAGEPIHARPTPAWERAFKWMQRQPALASLLAVGGLAVICLLALWIGFTNRLRFERDHAREEERLALMSQAAAQEQRAEAERQRKDALQQRARAETILKGCLTAIEANAEATVAAKQATRAPGEPYRLLFEVARYYAVAATSIAQDTGMDAGDRRRLADRYARDAVRLLQKAWESGYFKEKANLAKLGKEKDLDSLRVRADFQQLLRRAGNVGDR